MSLPIYLDYAATTPVEPAVVEKMSAYLSAEGDFGNPASKAHIYGWRAEEAVEKARKQVAELIGADSREIIWTSGATEANNLAIKGAAEARQSRGRHLITSSIEHKAVLKVFSWLEARGFDVTYLQPDENGEISAQQVEDALTPETTLVSVMHVNNELGTVSDIQAIGEVCRSRDVLFHVDAAQSAGKLPIDVQQMPVDLMSFSAHKLYGPKGIGALYIRRSPDVKVEAQMQGSDQERGLRAGTLPTHQIVGMGEAFAIARERLDEDLATIGRLKLRLLEGLKQIPAIRINGNPEQSGSGILNVSFSFVDGEALILGLRNLAVSSGSACTSASLEPSYVLVTLGVPDELAHSSIRFSVGRHTSEQEIDEAISQVKTAVERLRSISPLWDKYRAENGLMEASSGQA